MYLVAHTCISIYTLVVAVILWAAFAVAWAISIQIKNDIYLTNKEKKKKTPKKKKNKSNNKSNLCRNVNTYKRARALLCEKREAHRERAREWHQKREWAWDRVTSPIHANWTHTEINWNSYKNSMKACGAVDVDGTSTHTKDHIHIHTYKQTSVQKLM